MKILNGPGYACDWSSNYRIVARNQSPTKNRPAMNGLIPLIFNSEGNTPASGPGG
ncbi:MAG: hypothetical protein JNJ86_14950 [Chitinophagaceae bacterium]|nr:hypothetical protein [Chitinophagaceae bacterium]